MRSKLILVATATTSLAACAVSEQQEHDTGEAQVVITPTDIPFDPHCGAGLADEDVEIIEVEPTRITPSDRNGVLDMARLSIPTHFPAGGSMQLQRIGSCDNETTIPFDATASVVEWDGRIDKGEYAEPGMYLIMIGDPDSEILALGRIVIGIQDDVCVTRESEIVALHETRVSFGSLGFNEDISVAVPDTGYLCLSVERLGGSRMVPMIGINGVPLITNRSFTVETDELLVSQPVYTDQVKLRLGGVNGSYRARLGFIDDPSVSPPQPAAGADDDLPRSLTCRGRLQSYPHPFGEERPFWPGLDEDLSPDNASDVRRFEEGRRPVAREGIIVECAATFRRRDPSEETTYAYRRASDGYRPDIPALYAPAAIGIQRPDTSSSLQATARRRDTFFPGFPGFSIYPGLFDVIPEPFPPPDPRDFRSISATGVTDATGAYQITVDIEDTLDTFELTSLTARCRWNNDCGSGWHAYFTDDLDYGGPLDVIDVFDIQQGRRKARLLTNAGVTPIAAGHIRMPAVADSIAFENVSELIAITDSSPTIFVDNVALPAEMNDLPLVIHEPFDPLAEDAFDYMVWVLGGQPVSFQDFSKDGFELLDHEDGCQLDRENLCYGFEGKCEWMPDCSAGSSPVICSQQNILKPLLEGGYDIWLVDHGSESSVINVARDAPYLYQQVIRYPWIDDDRRIAVSGLSSGGVAARIALTMWERMDELPALVAEHDLQLVRPFTDGTLTERIDKVAAYFSLDSPHRGAQVPVALQAFMHDSGFPDDSRLPDLLESQSAREQLQNLVDPSIETNCFRKPPADCEVRPSTPDTEEYIADLPDTFGVQQFMRRTYVDPEKISRTHLDQLIRETIGVLGTGRGGSFWEEAFPDGLPQTPKSFAVANSWQYGAGPPFDAPEFLKADIKIQGILRTRKYDYDLFDFAQQPRGSTNPTVCKAYGLAGSPPKEHIFMTALGSCISDITAAGILVCGVGAGIRTFVDALLGNNPNKSVKVEMDIPMRYPVFIPTESAMNFVDGPGSVGQAAFGFEDALWRKRDPLRPDVKPVHFDVTEEACKFVRYHLDGTLKGDRDGIPACRPNMLASCAGGGMQPGDLLDSDGTYPDALLEFCDCDESTLFTVASKACSVHVLPGSGELRLNR